MSIRVPVGYDTDGAQLESEMTSDVTKASSKAGAAGGKAGGKRFSQSFRSGVKGVLAGLGLAAGLNEAKQFLGDSLAEARESQKVGAQTELLVRKLGKSAGVTAKGIDRLSNSIGRNTAIDDELVATGANVLLGFKNIRNEVGQGNKVFDRATAAAVDLSATPLFKGNLTAATKALGKALADPEKGLTALGRVGIKFSAQQTEQIKAFAKQGDALSAQKIILGEVEARYKGTAASQATASDKARFAINNLKEEIGNELLPVVDDLARFAANKAVPAISDFIAEFKAGTGPAGEIRDVLEDVGHVIGDVANVGRDLVGFFDGLPGPVKKTVLQLGLAYVAFRKLNTIMALAGTSGPATFVRGLTNAENRMASVRKSSFALGGGLRTLAGAGGLLALTQSSGDTVDAMDALRNTVGGAAAGFAVGGPIGAGIGFVAGGLKTLKDAFSSTDEAAKQSIPTFSSYASTLDEVTGASTKATKQLLFQDLQENGLLEKSKDLGISSRLLVQGLADQGTARSRLIAELQRQKAQTELNQAAERAAATAEYQNGNLSFAAFVKRADAIDQSYAATNANIDAILRQAGVLDKDRLSQLQANVATAEGKKQIRQATKALEEYGRTHGIGTAELRGYTKTKAQINDLKTLLRGVFALTGKANNVQQGGTIGDALGLDLLARGGPVRGGVPIIVGDGGRPEVFVPDQSGYIMPRVPTRSSATTSPSAVTAPAAAPLTIIQNDYGPRTGRAKISEMTWAIKYGTHARGGAV